MKCPRHAYPSELESRFCRKPRKNSSSSQATNTKSSKKFKQNAAAPGQRGFNAVKCIARLAGMAITAKHAKLNVAAFSTRFEIEISYPERGTGRTNIQVHAPTAMTKSRVMKSRFVGIFQIPLS